MFDELFGNCPQSKLMDFLITAPVDEFTKQQSKLPHKILIENEKVGRTENYLIVNLTKDMLKNHKVGDVIDIKNF